MPTYITQLDSICDTSNRRFPGPIQPACSDIIPQDWGYRCSGIVVQDGNYHPWNNQIPGQGTGGNPPAGYTKNYRPNHVSSVYVHFVAGEWFYQHACLGNAPPNLASTYNGVVIDEVIPDVANPSTYLWLKENNSSCRSCAGYKQGNMTRPGPLCWGKYRISDFLNFINQLGVLAIVVVADAATVHEYPEYPGQSPPLNVAVAGNAGLLGQLKLNGNVRAALVMYDNAMVDRLHAGAQGAGATGMCWPWFNMDSGFVGYYGQAQALQHFTNQGLASVYTNVWGFYEWQRSTDAIRSNSASLLP